MNGGAAAPDFLPIGGHVEQPGPGQPAVVAALEQSAGRAVSASAVLTALPDAEHRFSIRQQHRVRMPLPVGFGALRDDDVAVGFAGDVHNGRVRRLAVNRSERRAVSPNKA